MLWWGILNEKKVLDLCRIPTNRLFFVAFLLLFDTILEFVALSLFVAFKKRIRLDPRHDVNGFVHVMHYVNSIFHVTAV